MISMSKKLKIDLVTTEKDIIKIPKKYHKDIKVAKVSIKMESESKFLNLISKTSKSIKISGSTGTFFK